MSNQFLPKNQSEARSKHQQLFIKYTLAILIDLTVLNLFSEYWDSVLIDTFTTSLLAAILLQLLFQVTIVVEHHIVDYFKSKSGTGARVLGLLSTWIALFIFKLIIL